MKTTITFSTFCDGFRDADRNENFSYDGKRALFDYLEQYEEECCTELDFDVVALCCDYNEMDMVDIVREYRIDVSECEDDADVVETVTEYLNDNTQLVAVLDGNVFLFANF